MPSRSRSFALASLLLLGAAPSARADLQVLKIASLAPEGSSWMKLFREWGKKIEDRSGGQVKIKFFAGGVAGDERDAVRKMRLGQMQGAAVTGIGLGLIQPEVRVLDLPFLFKNYDELDYVRTTLEADFKKKFEEKGYVFLNWGDVGPVHLFSNIPIKSRDDLRKTKLWAWNDDAIVRKLFAELGITGVPLGVPDVLPSLQTGLIDACYGSPLSTLALQWHSKVKYISSMVIIQSAGATVLTKVSWDKLTPDQQKIVVEESKLLQSRLLKQVREDNDKALAKMKSLGLQVVETPAALVSEFQQQSKTLRASLDGQLYTKEFRQRVEQVLAQKSGKP